MTRLRGTAFRAGWIVPPRGYAGVPMSQMPLFTSSGQVVLVDDPRGRIVYTPDIVSGDVARTWFGELLGSVPWKAQRRRMYERDVDVPRLTAHFWLAPEN